MNEHIKWIFVHDELPADSLTVLLHNIYGEMHVGYRDEHGYYDHFSHDLEDITHWSYLPPGPIKGMITNDDWVEILAKKGLLE